MEKVRSSIVEGARHGLWRKEELGQCSVRSNKNLWDSTLRWNENQDTTYSWVNSEFKNYLDKILVVQSLFLEKFAK